MIFCVAGVLKGNNCIVLNASSDGATGKRERAGNCLLKSVGRETT